MAKKRTTITATDIQAPETLINHPFYGLELDEEEQHFRDCIYSKDYDIVFCNAKAGSGKTLVAVGTANLMVQYKLFEKIIYVTSPCAEGRLGFLPGTLTDKVSIYNEPLFSAMITCGINPYTAIIEDTLTSDKFGEAYIKPLTDVYLRGTNLDNAIIIVEESQNFATPLLKKTLTRIGTNTKTIVIGHTGQIDLDKPNTSGFEKYINHFKDKERCALCELHTNHRSWVSNWADELED
jgi:phosphate starvation-inducible protein PhoH